MIWFQAALFDVTPLPTGWSQSQLSASWIAVPMQAELLFLQATLSFAAIKTDASVYVLSPLVPCRMIAMAWDCV